MTAQDGHVTSRRPGLPARRTFTAAYKARILAEFDALPEGSPERGALLREERLYHSHLEHWRKQQESGTLPSSAGKPAKDGQSAEQDLQVTGRILHSSGAGCRVTRRVSVPPLRLRRRDENLAGLGHTCAPGPDAGVAGTVDHQAAQAPAQPADHVPFLLVASGM